ncbi:MAG: macro domain-containing protein, partial [Armatimonadota bacterium]
GGVAAAIQKAGGSVIREESDRISYVSEGHVATTSGGNLPAKYVIHAVGPKGNDPDADMKLTNAVLNSLKEADRLDVTSVAMPAISSGIFGFPKDRCAQILLETARDWLQSNPNSSVRQVDMTNIDDLTAGIFVDTFDEIFGQ